MEKEYNQMLLRFKLGNEILILRKLMCDWVKRAEVIEHLIVGVFALCFVSYYILLTTVCIK